MTDLSTLLHESAPTPRRPLDLDAVHERARRAGTRRRLFWLGGLGTLLALPIGAGTLVPAHDGADTVEARRKPAIVAPPTPEGAGLVASSDAGTAAGDLPGDTAGPSRPRTSETSPERPVSDTPTTTPVVVANVDHRAAPADPYPLATACSVDDVGHAPGEERRCRFTASAPGGASLRSSGPTSPVGVKGQVLITRDGQTTTHEIQYQRVRAGEFGAFACGGLVEPGDLVEVVLTTKNTPDDGTTTTLGAGEGWECWNGG